MLTWAFSVVLVPAAYFGLQSMGQCWCGNDYGKYKQTDCADCTESLYTFFGNNKNCVYETVAFPSELPSIAPTAAPTVTDPPSALPSVAPTVSPRVGNCPGQHELTGQIKTDRWVPETT